MIDVSLRGSLYMSQAVISHMRTCARAARARSSACHRSSVLAQRGGGIFVKDMGLVVAAARESRFATPLAHAVLLSFLAANGKGWGALDDSPVMRNYAPGPHTDD